MQFEAHKSNKTCGDLRVYATFLMEIPYDPKNMEVKLRGISKQMFKGNDELVSVSFVCDSTPPCGFSPRDTGVWEFHRKDWETRKAQSSVHEKKN